MESYLFSDHYDLVTPDGKITQIKKIDPAKLEISILIENISPAFVGFKIDPSLVIFDLKSTLGQIGLHAISLESLLDPVHKTAEIKLHLIAYGSIALRLLELLTKGAYIGKLFAQDPRRKVKDPDYLLRMFGRADRLGSPLLSFGGMIEKEGLFLEKIEGRVVAFLPLLKGVVTYEDEIFGFLPILEKALHDKKFKTRELLPLSQKWNPGQEKKLQEKKILLVRTEPLHVRTVFGKVIHSLLPQGYEHTAASILAPETKASGNIYEFFGSSREEIERIPLEFYTLEPHREYIYFSDRDQLQSCLENTEDVFKAFSTAPGPSHKSCAVFIVKGEQFLNLTPSDWITREPHPYDFPGLAHPETQGLLAERYIEQQAAYPFLKSMEEGLITSQGVLFCRYFPSPLMKKILFGTLVQKCLKGIYFQFPSHTYGDFFSHEDRSFLLDLSKFGIPVFWADTSTKKILKYIVKPGKDSGMFVPLAQVETFINATTFGLYGSNLTEGTFEKELLALMKGILELKNEVTHLLLNKHTPITLVTGGGPGVMELGNKVARSLNILSCANIADFKGHKTSVVNEQKQNPYIDAKMTYRLDRLVERQAEFNLDFPIFLIGGIGTDFEFALEEVRRKVGSVSATPVLLFGDPEYWKQKITPIFQCNQESGTIVGSEWVSNCFFCVQNAKQALNIYRKFFNNTLKIGKDGPIYPEGFVL